MISPVSPQSTSDSVLAILLFYHIFGGIMILQYTFMKGTPIFIMPRFDSAQFLSNIQKYKITFSYISPPILVTLNRLPDVDRYVLSSLEILFSGAAPLGETLAQDVKERLESRWTNNQALNITQGYGLTETSSTTHIILPPVALKLRLVVDDDGDGNIDAEEGQPGELWIRGPSVMKGYHGNPAATKDSITHDGLFKTGGDRDPRFGGLLPYRGPKEGAD